MGLAKIENLIGVSRSSVRRIVKTRSVASRVSTQEGAPLSDSDSQKVLQNVVV